VRGWAHRSVSADALVTARQWLPFLRPRSAEAGLRAERRDASVPTGRDPASGVTMPPSRSAHMMAAADMSRLGDYQAPRVQAISGYAVRVVELDGH